MQQISTAQPVYSGLTTGCMGYMLDMAGVVGSSANHVQVLDSEVHLE